MDSKIIELEERIKALEDFFNKMTFSDEKEITLSKCPIGNLHLGANSKVDVKNGPIGSIIDTNIDDAEDRLDELESKLDDINANIDDAESRLDGLDKAWVNLNTI